MDRCIASSTDVMERISTDGECVLMSVLGESVRRALVMKAMSSLRTYLTITETIRLRNLSIRCGIYRRDSTNNRRLRFGTAAVAESFQYLGCACTSSLRYFDPTVFECVHCFTGTSTLDLLDSNSAIIEGICYLLCSSAPSLSNCNSIGVSCCHTSWR